MTILSRRTDPGHTWTSASAVLGVALTLLLGTPGPATAAGRIDLPPPPPASATASITAMRSSLAPFFTSDPGRVTVQDFTMTRKTP